MLKDSTFNTSHTFLEVLVLQWNWGEKEKNSRAGRWESEFKGLWDWRGREHSSKFVT